MTVRAILNRRYRRSALAIYGGAAVFVVGAIGHQAIGTPEWTVIPGLIGFAVAWLTMMGSYFLLRCPACGARLFQLLLAMGGPRLRLDPRLRCCPYCTQDFDAELPAK